MHLDREQHVSTSDKFAICQFCLHSSKKIHIIPPWLIFLKSRLSSPWLRILAHNFHTGWFYGIHLIHRAVPHYYFKYILICWTEFIWFHEIYSWSWLGLVLNTFFNIFHLRGQRTRFITEILTGLWVKYA